MQFLRFSLFIILFGPILSSLDLVGSLLTKNSGRTDKKNNYQDNKGKCIREGGLPGSNQCGFTDSNEESAHYCSRDGADATENRSYEAFHSGK